MSRLSKTVKILAAAGIAFNGVLTVDAMALARALETGSPVAVENFIVQHNQSEYVGDAMMYLAKNDKSGGKKGGDKGGKKGGSKGGGGSSGGSGGSSGGSGGGSGGSSGDSDDDAGSGNGSRFKPAGDKGRPDLFGPPGTPVIGPPGQYQG